MRRRVLLAVGLLLALAVVAAGLGLTLAHRAMRAERVLLPERDAIAAAIAGDDRPVRLSILNTASQPMKRDGVLDPERDPSPEARYVMSHPSFVLEWADGRILLIDAGMTRDGAAAFGRQVGWLATALPIEPHGSVAEQLGEARARVRAIAFTHLHEDHVGGVAALCESPQPIRAFATEAQDARPNYTTRAGRRLLDEVGCIDVERLDGTGAIALPGFPGVAVIRAAGHTPGSQILVAAVAWGEHAQRYVFTGDTVNALDGVKLDVPKPTLYSLLVVPEDTDRQSELRRFLRDLVAAGYQPLVSHDQLELEKSGVPMWHPATSPPTH
jgi:glyoxylase-like metal-dependent hydrolase (beta-lactamase superfamily II)